jgi:hypothetical protein
VSRCVSMIARYATRARMIAPIVASPVCAQRRMYHRTSLLHSAAYSRAKTRSPQARKSRSRSPSVQYRRVRSPLWCTAVRLSLCGRVRLVSSVECTATGTRDVRSVSSGFARRLPVSICVSRPPPHNRREVRTQRREDATQVRHRCRCESTCIRMRTNMRAHVYIGTRAHPRSRAPPGVGRCAGHLQFAHPLHSFGTPACAYASRRVDPFSPPQSPLHWRTSRWPPRTTPPAGSRTSSVEHRRQRNDRAQCSASDDSASDDDSLVSADLLTHRCSCTLCAARMRAKSPLSLCVLVCSVR